MVTAATETAFVNIGAAAAVTATTYEKDSKRSLDNILELHSGNVSHV
jgi:hypothetical protein